MDRLEYDRHGIKRCASCGGPMKQTKFSNVKDQPRLWFRCMLGAFRVSSTRGLVNLALHAQTGSRPQSLDFQGLRGKPAQTAN